MGAVRTVGLVLAIVGGLLALGSAAMGSVSLGGSAGGSQPAQSGSASGFVNFSSGNLPFVSLGVCALGIVLVFLDRK
ncbi:MAG: hypothetical protein ACYDDF_04840 [Thermoplasmatota archaeon]